MRDYGKVSPTFWTGETGQAIREGGSKGVVVALYLMTSPMSNMLGLYHQPILYMAEETGLGLEGARKGLQQCLDAGFCKYDERTKIVWVIEMASFQIARELKAEDNRCKGIQKDYDGLPNNPFLTEFFEHYELAFNLKNCRSGKGATQAPPKPRALQEQEQEHIKGSIKAPSEDLFPGIDPQLVSDFKKLRKEKRASITATAVAGIRREAAKAGMTLEAAMETCCERGWAGFKAEWLNGGDRQSAFQAPVQTGGAASRKL